MNTSLPPPSRDPNSNSSKNSSSGKKTLVDLPSKGEQAVLSFIVKKRASAFRESLEAKICAKTFRTWKNSTKAKEKMRAALLKGEAHWQLNKSRLALEHWRAVAKISAWKKKMLRTGLVFCDTHRIEHSWSQWKQFVEERRKEVRSCEERHDEPGML